jgi:hypothetical protein
MSTAGRRLADALTVFRLCDSCESDSGCRRSGGRVSVFGGACALRNWCNRAAYPIRPWSVPVVTGADPCRWPTVAVALGRCAAGDDKPKHECCDDYENSSHRYSPYCV